LLKILDIDLAEHVRKLISVEEGRARKPSLPPPRSADGEYGIDVRFESSRD
jgi:hypothetical protein